MKLLACPSCKNRVMANMDCAPILKFSGSETASPALGITTDSDPLNVTTWLVPGSISGTPAAPPSGRATLTAVIGKSLRPNAFEIWILIWFAPRDV